MVHPDHLKNFIFLRSLFKYPLSRPPMTTIILGGGIAGLSLAYFLKDTSIILEKEIQLGGLGRSFQLNGISYDVGPHILFSKNKEVLNFHLSLIPTNTIRRSNKILHQGKFIKYPFENDLASLTPQERDYCLQEFLNNPYEQYPASTMLQFFLKTFGEGITRLYLQPYNEKIWKHDPAFLDTQMVERIPKPPKEDVIKSAQGIATEGYTHQLHFQYPSQRGFQSLIDAYVEKIKDKGKIIHPITLLSVQLEEKKWTVTAKQGKFTGEQLVNCMPLHELFNYLPPAPGEIQQAVKNLKYNSIHIVVVQTKKDTIGDNFSVTIADKEIIFHRLSKLNFLGPAYCLPDGGSSLLVEITYRPGSSLAMLSSEQIKERVLQDLETLKLMQREDLLAIELRSFPYAYVVYDLDHQKNTAQVLDYLKSIGIRCCGRFAEFQYMNSDQVVEHSQNLAKELNGES